MASLFSRQALSAFSKAKPSAFRLPVKAAPVVAFSAVPRRCFSVTLNRLANVPAELKYTDEHEWVRIEGTKAKIGVTDHAQKTLGDIVFLEVNDGETVVAGEAMGVIESVKAASDLYAPVSGKITAVNQDVIDSPEEVNSDPYGAWLAEIELSSEEEAAKLLTAEQYNDLIKE